MPVAITTSSCLFSSSDHHLVSLARFFVAPCLCSSYNELKPSLNSPTPTQTPKRRTWKARSSLCSPRSCRCSSVWKAGTGRLCLMSWRVCLGVLVKGMRRGMRCVFLSRLDFFVMRVRCEFVYASAAYTSRVYCFTFTRLLPTLYSSIVY